MKIFLTGATGLIGIPLLLLLSADSTIDEIVILTRNNHTSSLFLNNPKIKTVIVNFYDIDNFEKIITDSDIVVHLLWSNFSRTSGTTLLRDIDNNLIQTIKLLEAAATKGIKKIIFASSGGTVYGITAPQPISENILPKPISSYGITKLAIENYLHYFYHHFGLEYTILRIATAYGEFQNLSKKQGVIAHWLYNIAHNRPIDFYGDGTIIRDYIYATDVAQAILQAIMLPSYNGILNIGSGIGTNLTELLNIITNITEKKIAINYLPSNIFDVPCNILAVKEAQKHLKWTPTTSLSIGIQKIYGDILNH